MQLEDFKFIEFFEQVLKDYYFWLDVSLFE